MMTARKGLLIGGAVALFGGGVAGIGLGNYAQSGAFEFYKQAPPAGAQNAVASAAADAGYYPMTRSAAPPAYPEAPSPPHAITIARPAEPADYRRAAQLAAQDTPPAETLAARADDVPVIQPQAGSWTAPASQDAPASDDGVY